MFSETSLYPHEMILDVNVWTFLVELNIFAQDYFIGWVHPNFTCHQSENSLDMPYFSPHPHLLLLRLVIYSCLHMFSIFVKLHFKFLYWIIMCYSTLPFKFHIGEYGSKDYSNKTLAYHLQHRIMILNYLRRMFLIIRK